MKIQTPVKVSFSKKDGETKLIEQKTDKKTRNELNKFKFVSLEYLDDTLFDEDNVKTFQKLQFLLTPDQIQTIVGKTDKYDFNKMETEEDIDSFTSLNSSNLMRYIFIRQIHYFLDTNLKQSEHQVLAKFLVNLLDIIEKDYKMSIYTKKDIQNIIDKIRFSQDYYSYLQSKKTIPTDIQFADRDDEIETVDLDAVKQNFIEEYRAEHDGEDPDEQVIDDYAEQFQYDQGVDAEIENDLYDSENVALDAGDYGMAGQEVEDGE